ncbi:peptidase M61 [Vandammella animalimorsus]|uniref:Peptidase M61 n=1 Tax=Vandammella animalimorsus TaxID=2029117 RepID=A0A2A2T3X3_9BURK|nr:M61 family metallopeptidase [Vandammella animalimorsus]PAT31626.1 peptidase M61 [Vandammella animalimorsus]PAX16185.1 peptidase M61 [Vandammella animalimorsus]PAX18215.1 peptidase M61 [Vandammella animalimorsus]
MPSQPKPPAPPALPVQYIVEPSDPHGHQFHVTLHIAAPAAEQIVSLPVWIPGSYLVREFARHLHGLQASQSGAPVAVRALSKNRWHIAAQPGSALTLRYRVYAFDHSVRAAWLDGERAFFNPTSLCLRVHGQEAQPHGLQLPRPDHAPDWRVATALPPAEVDEAGFGLYRAADYDELADSPVELGAFWQGQFSARGIVHRFVVAGATSAFDGQRLLQDAQRICEAAIDFWHPPGAEPSGSVEHPPHGHYLFLLNAVGSGYGGLEHRHSTALICQRSDLPRQGAAEQPEGYTTLLGLISHEYFHTWNVKRLRPAEFARYDYDQENYTELLWFFEGFTSYYDDLLLRRAGLLDDAHYLKLLGKTIQQVEQTPGRHVQSVAQASFDAWIKYYRQDENTANATVSYYTKGALVALCLDLQLRQHGRCSLDDVMRALWQRSNGGPIDEAAVLDTLAQLSGRDWQAELQHWVHSTAALPLAQALASAGLALEHKPASWAQRLGLQLREAQGSALTISRIHSGSAAERAGMAVGDEWLGLAHSHSDGASAGGAAAQPSEAAGWRLKKLDELDGLLPDASAAQGPLRVLLARDGRLLWRTLQLPATQEVAGDVRLQPLPEPTAQQAQTLRSWLGPATPPTAHPSPQTRAG